MDNPFGHEAFGDPERWQELMRELAGDDPQAFFEKLTSGQLDDEQLRRIGEILGLPENPAMIRAALSQVQHVIFTPHSSGPVNWDLAQILATQGVQQLPSQPPTDEDRQRYSEHIRLAELWLDEATIFPSPNPTINIISPKEWVEKTLPTWKTLADPVGQSLAQAFEGALAEHAADPMMMQMLRPLTGAIFGLQMGQASAALAGEVFGGTDTGFPLLSTQESALVPENISKFSSGLDIPQTEIELFMTVRELAHLRLFQAANWLAGHVRSLVQRYASELQIDTEAIEDTLRQIDPSQVQEIQLALSDNGLFQPTQSEGLIEVSEQLQRILALIEGWVDHVTVTALRSRLPQTSALQEMMSRRRASGGPAEQTFASLIGLELRPKNARKAALLWEHLGTDSMQERDEVWLNPDRIPTAEDLEDPESYGQVPQEDDLDRALAKLLSEAQDTEGDSSKGGLPNGNNPNDNDTEGEGPVDN